ncbi:MAG: T9SS type B sorting domain-containing protein, partial [Bacteroidota bacterium]
GGLPQVIDTTVSLMATDTLQIPAAWFAGGGMITASNLADQRCNLPLSLMTRDTLVRPDTIRRFDVTCRPEGLMIGGRLFTAAMPSDTFLVDDGSDCGLRFEVDITFLAPEATDTMEVFICPGTSFEIPATGDVFDANRPEGEVAYPRPGQCDSLVYVRLDIPEVSLGSFGASACEGDTIFLGDRFFTIDNPAGVATLEGEAANGCDSLVTVNVNFRRVGELRLLGDHEICLGDSVELRFAYDGPGGINAVLEDFQGNTMTLNNLRDRDRIEITPTASTTWSIISAEAGGCPGTFSGRSVIEISDLSLQTEILTDPLDFCNDTLGRAIALPAGGQAPYDIAWSNGPLDSLNPNLLAGTYFVEVVDAQGCRLRDSAVIAERRALTARVSALPPLCEGGSGRLVIDTLFGGAGGYQVSLDDDFFLPVERVEDFRPPIGFGIATFRDADDCLTTASYVVPDALRPTFNPLTDTTIFIGDSVLLDPQVVFPFDSISWTPPATLRSPGSLQTIAAPRQTTDYTLDLISSDGCAFTYRVRVRVDERLPVYAPTGFSPNGDDVNDVYRLEYGDRVEALLSFQIFNRWGNQVYEGLDGWDGVFAGRPAQSAVYVFQATVRLVDGTERYLKGHFVLRR